MGTASDAAPEAIRQKTQGEDYQPIVNHSKLTDSNDCTEFYFSSFRLLLLFRLPSSLCLLPDILAGLRAPGCAPGLSLFDDRGAC